MNSSIEHVRKTKKEIERKGERESVKKREREERERKRATNWLQSCELKTQRKTSRSRKGG